MQFGATPLRRAVLKCCSEVRVRTRGVDCANLVTRDPSCISGGMQSPAGAATGAVAAGMAGLHQSPANALRLPRRRFPAISVGSGCIEPGHSRNSTAPRDLLAGHSSAQLAIFRRRPAQPLGAVISYVEKEGGHLTRPSSKQDLLAFAIRDSECVGACASN